MKKQIKDLTEQEKIKTLDALYTSVSAVSGRDKVKRLLKDLLTESERVMLGRRILIAKLLLSGATSREITTRLGAGPDTIYRVRRWLEDQLPGYEDAIKGMDKEMDRRRNPFSLQKLKKKYPQHFLLMNILDELKKK